MSRMPHSSPPVVIVTPDALARAILDPAAGTMLLDWRDGRIRLAANRCLAIRYLRLLHRMGASERLLRWWAWRFGSKQSVEWLPSPEVAADLKERCEQLARASGSETIIHGGPTVTNVGPGSDHLYPRWVPLAEYAACFPQERHSTT
jgi:hypothetical protein